MLCSFQCYLLGTDASFQCQTLHFSYEIVHVCFFFYIYIRCYCIHYSFLNPNGIAVFKYHEDTSLLLIWTGFKIIVFYFDRCLALITCLKILLVIHLMLTGNLMMYYLAEFKPVFVADEQLSFINVYSYQHLQVWFTKKKCIDGFS